MRPGDIRKHARDAGWPESFDRYTDEQIAQWIKTVERRSWIEEHAWSLALALATAAILAGLALLLASLY